MQPVNLFDLASQQSQWLAVRQAAIAVWVWSNVSAISPKGCRNRLTRNMNATTSPALIPHPGPQTTPTNNTAAIAMPPKKSLIGSVVA